MFNALPYNAGGDLEHVNFFTGPFGINQALQAHDGETNAVLSSGWGAANASLLLMQLQAKRILPCRKPCTSSTTTSPVLMAGSGRDIRGLR